MVRSQKLAYKVRWKIYQHVATISRICGHYQHFYRDLSSSSVKADKKSCCHFNTKIHEEMYTSSWLYILRIICTLLHSFLLFCVGPNDGSRVSQNFFSHFKFLLPLSQRLVRVSQRYRTSVSGQRSFAVLRSTCSWWVTTYVSKPSAIGQPTRPTQPFILGVDKWVVGCN